MQLGLWVLHEFPNTIINTQVTLVTTSQIITASLNLSLFYKVTAPTNSFGGLLASSMYPMIYSENYDEENKFNQLYLNKWLNSI